MLSVSPNDGCEELADNPARGQASGGWVTFKPEGLPKWKGKGGFHSSLWELSRFSGGREQDGKRPPVERVGGKDIPITSEMKADVRRFLSETRDKGGNLIVRLGYTWSGDKGCEPADFEMILGHIRDLSRIMAEFPDVVVGVEAGVAGPWGEMHSSDYCAEDFMKRILRTYLDNLAPSTPLLVRAPRYLEWMDYNPRIGMFNDGYLGTWWDYGTWAGKFTRERGCEILKPRTNLPYGGELAYVSRAFLDENKYRSLDLWNPEKWNIVRDWYDVHLSYLRNIKEGGHTLATFMKEVPFDSRRWAYDGMPRLDEYDGQTMSKFVTDHMGYRFVIRDNRSDKTIECGKPYRLALKIENTGFGSLSLESKAEILLVSASKVTAVPIELHLEKIAGGSSAMQVFDLPIPRNAAGGKVTVAIQVKAAGSGRVIRFANAGSWRDDIQANVLGVLPLW